MTEITAQTILALLAGRHHKDVFVSQCKDGPTWGSHHLRMDAWAMLRSWTQPNIYAYEIKVSRSDFLRDDKWQAYLPFCNEFYFACPSKLILPTELPAEAGLLWVSKTGTRLWAKKKAARRRVDIPETLWRYLLICRARITREHGVDTATFWREWLAQKKENRHVGHMASRAIAEHMRDVEHENSRLASRMEAYDAFAGDLERIGIDPGDLYSSWERERQAKRLSTGIPDGLKAAVERISDATERARLLIAEAEEHD